MHPLFLTIIRRPDLVMDHLSAYAALFKQETNDASKLLMRRVLAWLMAVMFVAIFVVFSGVALMLGVLQNQFHWILVAVPGAMAFCALLAFFSAKQAVLADRFAIIKSQLVSDAAALRAAAGSKVN
jgi:Kef-type K+ transport system membrane component KefB